MNWLIDAIIETAKLFAAGIALILLVGVPMGAFFGIAVLADAHGNAYLWLYVPFFILLTALGRVGER